MRVNWICPLKRQSLTNKLSLFLNERISHEHISGERDLPCRCTNKSSLSLKRESFTQVSLSLTTWVSHSRTNWVCPLTRESLTNTIRERESHAILSLTHNVSLSLTNTSSLSLKERESHEHISGERDLLVSSVSLSHTNWVCPVQRQSLTNKSSLSLKETESHEHFSRERDLLVSLHEQIQFVP